MGDDTVPGSDLDDRNLFDGKHAIGITTEARSMICTLLNRDAAKRPGMHQIAEHGFLTKEDVDVFSLYKNPAYPLDVGEVAASPDHAQWSRRQFSSIWSPQPAAYDISLTNSSSTKGSNRSYPGGISNKPIRQGDERIGFFSSSGTISANKLKPEQKKMLLPPS